MSRWETLTEKQKKYLEALIDEYNSALTYINPQLRDQLFAENAGTLLLLNIDDAARLRPALKAPSVGQSSKIGSTNLPAGFRGFGGSTPSALGIKLAQIARSIHETLPEYLKRTTVAVTEVNGKTFVAVNGGSKSAEPFVKQWADRNGAQFISNPGGSSSHAERFLYEHFNGKLETIGISRRTELCEDGPNCAGYFLGKPVEIAY